MAFHFRSSNYGRLFQLVMSPQLFWKPFETPLMASLVGILYRKLGAGMNCDVSHPRRATNCMKYGCNRSKHLCIIFVFSLHLGLSNVY